MNNKPIITIGMREFMRNTKAIKSKVAKGQTFEVLDHTEPVFRIVPAIPTGQKRKYQFADLAQFQFSGPTDLSESVDKKLYG